MLKPEEVEWYQEADRRGLLNPEEKEWFGEYQRRFSAPPQAQPKKYDPTEGMSGFDKFYAGMGKRAADWYRGLNELTAEGLNKVGIVPDETVKYLRQQEDEIAARDKPLMDTWQGTAGGLVTDIGIPMAGGAVLSAVGTLANAPAAINAGRALMAPKTVSGAVGIGTAIGGLQPVGTDESRAENALKSGALSGVVTGGMKTAEALVKGGAAGLRNLYHTGREKTIGNTLNYYAGAAPLPPPLTSDDPAEAFKAAMIAKGPRTGVDETIQALRNAPEYVPGSVPTLAEAAPGNAGLAQLQRNLSGLKQSNEALAARAIENNAARIRALESLAGDEVAIASLKEARNKAIAPLRAAVSKAKDEVVPRNAVKYIDMTLKSATGQREGVKSGLSGIRDKLVLPFPVAERTAEAKTILSSLIDNPPKGPGRYISNIRALEVARDVVKQVDSGVLSPKEAVSQLNRVKSSVGVYKDAIAQTKKILQSETKYQTSPEQLYGVRDYISDLLNKKGEGGDRVYATVSRELSGIQKMIDRSIGKKVPAYSQYMSEYRNLSRPIQQMQVAGEILDKSTSALKRSGDYPALHPEAYARNLKNTQSMVNKLSGYKRAKGLEAVFDQPQIDVLQGVKADLERSVKGQNLGRASVGSNTAQNLASADAMRSLLGPLGWPLTIADSKIGRNLVAPLDMLGKFTADEIDAIMARAATDPRYAAQLMSKARGRESLLAPYLRGGGAALRTYAPLGLLNQE